MAGGEGDLACPPRFFDLFSPSPRWRPARRSRCGWLPRPWASNFENVEVNIEVDLDFRGTMGIDAETPVGFQQIRTTVEIRRDTAPDRVQRLASSGRAVRRRRHLCEGTTLSTNIAARGRRMEAAG